ncbi:unnamed protein product [Ranitomeya imitator]|uniref:Serine carboxypeptidase n=1 Tax=Ranitomeya imitator TaxID=111125 RepID=A0ABN9KU55_9NEOB|nr:unnamed protein product [Ranitomeya imitator]
MYHKVENIYSMLSPESAPVLLWLQGGPGGSSMFGLFVEHGPYVVNKNLTLVHREFAWTNKYSMLYIDNPVGTGFSFTKDDRGYAVNQDDVGRDLYSALTQFYQIFPEYQKNEFYATGESYAGKYVPAIGYYIHTLNPSAKVKINFKGIAIGDGLCDPEVMLAGYADFMFQTGIVDENQKAYVQQQCDLAIYYIQQQKWIDSFDVNVEIDFIRTPMTAPRERSALQEQNLQIQKGGTSATYQLVSCSYRDWILQKNGSQASRLG